MKIFYTLFLFCLSLSLFAQERPPCDSEFYRVPGLFSEIDVTEVQYAENFDNFNVIQRLRMDIYDPLDNPENVRPILVLAHGGSFITGNKSQLEEVCQTFSSMGYVTASINYRLYNFLGGLPDSLAMLDVAAKAHHDMKAAVRYLKSTAAKGNPYRIDTNMVVVGGFSAGSIAALHAAYLDEMDTIPDYLSEIIAENGGYDGDTFADSLAGFTDVVHNCINGSGALYRASYLDSTDQVGLFSYHGTADETVPFGAGIVAPGGIEILFMEGSDVLHERAKLQEVRQELISVPGGGHTDIYDPEGMFGDSLTSYFLKSAAFIADDYCEGTITSTTEIITEQFEVFPNPTLNEIIIPRNIFQQNISSVEIIDMSGIRRQYPISDQRISVGVLSSGVHVLRIITGDDKMYQSRFIKY